MVVVEKDDVVVHRKDIVEKLDNETAHKESLKAISTLSHGDTIHAVGQFKCDPCDKTFRRAYNLKKHELAKHQMKRFQCKQCDSNYSLAYSLSLHVQSVHEGKMVECNMCDYKTATKGSFKAHLRARRTKIAMQFV